MKNNKLSSLIICYLIVFVFQTLGSLFTAHSVSSWYKSLEKPSWNPPNWVFGPAWTLLFITIAISLWLVYQTQTGKSKGSAYFIFFIQLILNAFWSYLFFYLNEVAWALLGLGLLIVSIGLMIYFFYKIRLSAALILIPYLLWCLYAFSLNAAIWKMN